MRKFRSQSRRHKRSLPTQTFQFYGLSYAKCECLLCGGRVFFCFSRFSENSEPSIHSRQMCAIAFTRFAPHDARNLRICNENNEKVNVVRNAKYFVLYARRCSQGANTPETRRRQFGYGMAFAHCVTRKFDFVFLILFISRVDRFGVRCDCE